MRDLGLLKRLASNQPHDGTEPELERRGRCFDKPLHFLGLVRDEKKSDAHEKGEDGQYQNRVENPLEDRRMSNLCCGLLTGSWNWPSRAGCRADVVPAVCHSTLLLRCVREVGFPGNSRLVSAPGNLIDSPKINRARLNTAKNTKRTAVATNADRATNTFLTSDPNHRAIAKAVTARTLVRTAAMRIRDHRTIDTSKALRESFAP